MNNRIISNKIHQLQQSVKVYTVSVMHCKWFNTDTIQDTQHLQYSNVAQSDQNLKCPNQTAMFIKIQQTRSDS